MDTFVVRVSPNEVSSCLVNAITNALGDPINLCNALFNYLIILLDVMIYVYILCDFDDYVTCDVLLFYCLIK